MSGLRDLGGQSHTKALNKTEGSCEGSARLSRHLNCPTQKWIFISSILTCMQIKLWSVGTSFSPLWVVSLCVCSLIAYLQHIPDEGRKTGFQSIRHKIQPHIINYRHSKASIWPKDAFFWTGGVSIEKHTWCHMEGRWERGQYSTLFHCFVHWLYFGKKTCSCFHLCRNWWANNDIPCECAF